MTKGGGPKISGVHVVAAAVLLCCLSLYFFNFTSTSFSPSFRHLPFFASIPLPAHSGIQYSGFDEGLSIYGGGGGVAPLPPLLFATPGGEGLDGERQAGLNAVISLPPHVVAPWCCLHFLFSFSQFPTPSRALPRSGPPTRRFSPLWDTSVECVFSRECSETGTWAALWLCSSFTRSPR